MYRMLGMIRGLRFSRPEMPHRATEARRSVIHYCSSLLCSSLLSPLDYWAFAERQPPVKPAGLDRVGSHHLLDQGHGRRLVDHLDNRVLAPVAARLVGHSELVGIPASSRIATKRQSRRTVIPTQEDTAGQFHHGAMRPGEGLDRACPCLSSIDAVDAAEPCSFPTRITRDDFIHTILGTHQRHQRSVRENSHRRFTEDHLVVGIPVARHDKFSVITVIRAASHAGA